MRAIAILLGALIAVCGHYVSAHAVKGKPGIHSDVRVNGSVLEPRKLEGLGSQRQGRGQAAAGFHSFRIRVNSSIAACSR
jgi:hypothetical protein